MNTDAQAMQDDERRAAAEAHYGEPVVALTRGGLTLWVPQRLVDEMRARRACAPS